jgi:protein TonB
LQTEVLVYISNMKISLLTTVFILLAGFAFAQEVPNIPEPASENRVELVEQMASFPGGESGLYGFIGHKSTEPQLIALFGFTGRVVIGFTVDPNGIVKNAHAISNSGTGYEEVIIAIVSNGPRWKPAIQNGTPVQEKFAIPFKLDVPRDIIDMKELKKSDYKFTFQIKDKTYDIDEAETILGKKFNSAKIDYAKSFNEQPEENKQRKTYLIQIKD